MELPDEIEMAVFETAIQIVDDELRTAYLAWTFRDSPEARLKMEGLLCAELESQAFFHEAAITRGRVAGDLLSSGQVDVTHMAQELGGHPEDPVSVGSRYRILKRIGEGGGGFVYLAVQQEPVRRSVAIKILRFGMDTPAAFAAFEREGQALALMNHPNIAHIFDAGATEEGRPYFVMELVEGEKITDFCETHRFGILQRLELFILVCGAIQHAHQKGIIHRDIKPSNVLVLMNDGHPVPKVIDFGIARTTAERKANNRMEPYIGTPAYMSPEQAENGGVDVDTRSDVYALGVLLHELLTGATPHDPKLLMKDGVSGLARALREHPALPPSEKIAMITHDDLPKLSALRKTAARGLSKALRGDLDAIMMKSLEPDRQHRYDTVNNLATDLRRHIEGVPVMAHPPGSLYFCRKFVRRNRLAVLSLASVIAALFLGATVSFWSYLRERDALGQAELARSSEFALRQQAQARETVAKVAILLNDGKIDEADVLLREAPLSTIQPSLEAAKVFRFLGERNAILGRWKQASECFVKLMDANRLEDPQKTALGSDLLVAGPALLEDGNIDGYDRIRREMLARFPKTTNAIAAEHMVKMSLLMPADDKMLSLLEPMAGLISNDVNRYKVRPGGPNYNMAWNALSVSLFEYRKRNDPACLEMAEITLRSDGSLPSRTAAAKVLSAMALHRLGQKDAAHQELEIARKMAAEFTPRVIAKTSDSYRPDSGTWNSWAVTRILLREAESALGK